jgi:hypothetical protein
MTFYRRNALMSDELWFEYHGERLEPFHHLYNLTFLNERCIELAIARQWLPECAWHLNPGGLEVGNVMGHYWPMRHTVFDLYEPPAWYQLEGGQKVIDVDLLSLDEVEHPWFPWVVSLSTIEHTANPIKALEILYSLVEPGGRLLVSFPTGVDDRLDSWAEELPDMANTRACTIVRDGNDHGGWVQTPKPQLREYGPWANSVAIVEWSR